MATRKSPIQAIVAAVSEHRSQVFHLHLDEARLGAEWFEEETGYMAPTEKAIQSQAKVLYRISRGCRFAPVDDKVTRDEGFRCASLRGVREAWSRMSGEDAGGLGAVKKVN